jgi:hypothetical protein
MVSDSPPLTTVRQEWGGELHSPRVRHVTLGAKTALCFFGHLTNRDAQCVGYSFAVCRVGLQTIPYMPQLDFLGGITHCTSGIGK